MRQTILNAIIEAMKAKDKETLAVLRMVKGAMQLEEINLKHELTDDEVLTVLVKQIKTRKESIIEFEKGNRTDLIEATNKEIEILNKYMPEQLSDDEVAAIIDEAFIEIKPESNKDMGKIMAYVNPKLKGKTDMGKVSQIIKSKLS